MIHLMFTYYDPVSRCYFQNMKKISYSESYSKPCQTSTLGCFAKLVNGWQPWTILAKWYIHLRCLTGFWICLWYTLIYMLYLLLCNASNSNLKSNKKKTNKKQKKASNRHFNVLFTIFCKLPCEAISHTN